MSLLILALNVLSLGAAAVAGTFALIGLVRCWQRAVARPGPVEIALLLAAIVVVVSALFHFYGFTGIPRCQVSQAVGKALPCMPWPGPAMLVFPSLLVMLGLMPLMLATTALAPLSAAFSAFTLAAIGIFFMSVNGLLLAPGSLLLLAAAIAGNRRLARSRASCLPVSGPD